MSISVSVLVVSFLSIIKFHCFHCCHALLIGQPRSQSSFSFNRSPISSSQSSSQSSLASTSKQTDPSSPPPPPTTKTTNNNDPTSLFNNDIYRIASRTKAQQSNFNPIHAAEHAERMLIQMINMYKTSNKKTARPNITTFSIVLMGYANLKGYRWKKNNYYNDDDDDEGYDTSLLLSSFHVSSTVFTNEWGESKDQYLNHDMDVNNNNDNNNENSNNNRNSNNENSNNNDENEDRVPICAADRVEFILEQLYQLQINEIEAGNDITSLQLNTDVCNLALLTYARCAFPQNIALQYQEDNDNNHHNHNHDDKGEQQDNESKYPFLFHPTKQKGSYAEKAEQLVKYMLSLSKQSDGPNDKIEPNAQTYSYLIWALSKQQYDSRGQQHYEQFHNNDNINNNNDINLHQYANRASEWLPHLETIYNSIETKNGEYSHQKRLLRKFLHWAYSDILTAWSKCLAKKSPRKVYKLMTMIESLCEEDIQEINNNAYGNDSFMYDDDDNEESDYLNKSSSTKMCPPSYDDYEPTIHPNIPLYPTANCYTQTILALSKSKELGSAQRANQLLYKMLQIYESGNWGNNKPGVYAFNGVISAWANCASSAVGNADKAEKVLNLMEKLYFDEDRPEYNHLRPDSVSFNSAIKAWINCKEDAAIFNAEKLMERMEERYNEIGDQFLDVQPDSYTYNTMITGWLRSDLGIISPQNAEMLLRKMVEKYVDGDIDLAPNQMIFSSVIDKWAKSDPSKNIAMKHSIGLLELMESLYERGCTQLKPDKITYTNVIDAIARSRSPTGASKALSLLDKMEKKYKDGDFDIKPSAQTYSCILLSLLNSNMDDKHIIAKHIPNRMESLGVRPNAFTWNYLIHVAATVNNSDEKRMEAFKVALGAFQTLRRSKDIETDSFTYAFFLKAIKHLLPASVMRSSIAKETFLECAKEGKVNDQVLSRLVWALESQEVREIIGPVKKSNLRDVKASDLPAEWGSNVDRRRKKRLH